jgi:transposase
MIRKDGLWTGMKINNDYIFKNINMGFNMNNYGDSSITYHKCLNTVTLNLSTYVKKEISNNKGICGIDVGVKRFLTVYSENKVYQIGVDCEKKMNKVCREIDIIKSRIDTSSYHVNKDGIKITYKMDANRRRNLKKALHRKIEYLKNLKKELHNKSVKFLCDNFISIVIPPFRIKEMAPKLNNKTSRTLYNLL